MENVVPLIAELFAEQRDYLLARGIAPSQTTKLGVQFCTSQMLADRNIKWPHLGKGILWHTYDQNGVDTGNVGARVWYTGTEKDGPKFISPKGQVPRLYFSPLNPKFPTTGGTIVLCESYLKADIAALCGFFAVGISGVWGWSHHKALIEDFSRLPWKEMKLKLLVSFDSNVREDGENTLNLALSRLSSEMDILGAAVTASYLPPPDKDDWGLDDYYMKHGREKVVEMLSEPGTPIQSDFKHHLGIMNREVALIRDLNQIVDLDRGVFMSGATFTSVAYADRAVWVQINGKPKKLSTAKEWMHWDGRNTVERAVYEPGEDMYVADDYGASQYNLWKGMPFEPVENAALADMWEKWLKIALPNAVERHWFCCWWAVQLQELGIKLPTALVIVGESGVGKGWIAQIMRRIFGLDNYAPTDLGMLGGRFNADYANKMLIVVEEAKMPRGADGDAIYNKLKDLITNPVLRVERKGIDPFTVANHCNLVLQGNDIDILALDSFDRRFAVLEVGSPGIANNSEFWDPRWGAIDNGLPEAIYHWLLNYDLKTFDKYGPALVTDAREVMIEAGHSARAQWLCELKADPDLVLDINGVEVDGLIANARELEYVYMGGQVPLWEIEKSKVNAMARELRSARVQKANDGKKIKSPVGAPSRYFLVREPIDDEEVDSWCDEVANRKFWKMAYDR